MYLFHFVIVSLDVFIPVTAAIKHYDSRAAELQGNKVTPSQLVHTLTKNPGRTVYMVPETLSDSHRFGPSLDVFSFGHL